jgi:transitional endoplasmic reticulum ATPase
MGENIMKKSDKASAKLRIERLERDKSGRSLCYIDQDVMKNLGINTGDVIEIRGKKRTTGIAVSNTSDKGRGTIRLDGLQRLNAGATIGEFVSVQLADVSFATEIILTPTRPDIDLKRQADAIKSKLIDKPVVIGDIVDVLGTFVQRGDPDNPMSDLMKMLPFGAKKRTSLGTLRLVVENLNPDNKIVKITHDTLIKVNKRVAILNVSGGIVTYDDIGGLTEEIQQIRTIIEMPLKYPELFHKLGIAPPKGILLYGPSGVGKTLLIKALSQEVNANFIVINGPEIFSKYSGETEGKLREIFRQAEENAPSIIFIDKIESIAPSEKSFFDKIERRITAQLLTLMDGFRGIGEVIVIAETEKIERIFRALRRPGRFGIEIEIKPPDMMGRLEILRIHTRTTPLAEDVDLKVIAESTRGYVGADLVALIREAALLTIQEVLPLINLDEPITSDALDKVQIRMDHFLKALEFVKPSISD